MKSKYIVGTAAAAAFSLFCYELAEIKEPAQFFRAPYSGIDGTEATFAPCNHTHSELRIESGFNATNVLAASGATGSRGLDYYVLHLLPVFSEPENGERRIARIDLVGFSNIDRQQPMYGKFDSVEELRVLVDKLNLPELQVQSIRKSLLAGQRTEVGGRISALTFKAKSLGSIGMSFRPPA